MTKFTRMQDHLSILRNRLDVHYGVWTNVQSGLSSCDFARLRSLVDQQPAVRAEAGRIQSSDVKSCGNTDPVRMNGSYKHRPGIEHIVCTRLSDLLSLNKQISQTCVTDGTHNWPYRSNTI